MRYEYFKETLREATSMVDRKDTIEDIWEYMESRGINATCDMVIRFVEETEQKNRFNYEH